MRKEIKIRFVDCSNHKEKDVKEEMSVYSELIYQELGIKILWEYVKGKREAPPFKTVAQVKTSDRNPDRKYTLHGFEKWGFRLRYTLPAYIAGARMVYVLWDEDMWYSEYSKDVQQIVGQSLSDWLGVSECGFRADPNKRDKIGKNKYSSELVRLCLHEGIPGHGFWGHIIWHLKPAHMKHSTWDITHQIAYHHPDKLLELLRQAKSWIPALYPQNTIQTLREQLEALRAKLANRMTYPIEKKLFIENVTQGFGVKNPRYSAGIHTGLDQAAPEGTPVRAPWEGEMYQTFKNHKSMGNAGYFKFTKEGKTKYARFLHLKELPRKGKYKKGEIMALVGNTGMSDGSHVHHDLWKVPVDYNILRSQAKIKENMIDPYAFYRYEVDRVVV